jgi:hypothetical protein
MALSRETSLGVGLATGAMVYAIYQQALPTQADIRVGIRDDWDIDKTERTAAWLAAGAIGGVSLIAKDPTVFIMGGAMLIALSLWTKVSNAEDSENAKITNQTSRVTAA